MRWSMSSPPLSTGRLRRLARRRSRRRGGAAKGRSSSSHATMILLNGCSPTGCTTRRSISSGSSTVSPYAVWRLRPCSRHTHTGLRIPSFAAHSAIRRAKGHTMWCEGYRYDLAIAPLLTAKVPDEELRLADIGTLIFHPSPLPYGRGASSLKWAYRRGEPITAATWLWADSGYDTGDICE